MESSFEPFATLICNETLYNDSLHWEKLDKPSIKELTGITLSLQNNVEQYTTVKTNALEEIRKLNENFLKLEFEINIVKKVNTLLNRRVIDMERKCCAMPNIQEGSAWKLQVFLVMFPTRTWNRKCSKYLVKLVVWSSHAILKHVIVSHKIIVKFLRRKDCDQVMSVKRGLRKVKLEDIRLRGSNSISINPSLCPYDRTLWFKSERLVDLGKINNFYISSGKIKITWQENSKPLSKTQVEGFKKYFPDVYVTTNS